MFTTAFWVITVVMIVGGVDAAGDGITEDGEVLTGKKEQPASRLKQTMTAVNKNIFRFMLPLRAHALK